MTQAEAEAEEWWGSAVGHRPPFHALAQHGVQRPAEVKAGAKGMGKRNGALRGQFLLTPVDLLFVLYDRALTVIIFSCLLR